MSIEDESTNEISLAGKFPNSTPAERRRFLIACDDDLEISTERLGGYLDWIGIHNDEDEDAVKLAGIKDDWEYACKYVASKSDVMEAGTVLPRFINSGLEEGDTRFVDKKGNRMVYIMAATLDSTLADADTYSLIFAIYMKRTASRNSMEKLCVALDVRAGEGWANPNVLNSGSMLKATCNLINNLFPETLDRVIVYPVPTFGTYIWSVLKIFLDPVTAEKVKLEAGGSSRTDPTPESMSQYFDADTLERMKKCRDNNQVF